MSWKVLKNTKTRIRLKVSHIFYNHLQRINVTPDTTFDAAPMKRVHCIFLAWSFHLVRATKIVVRRRELCLLIWFVWNGRGLGWVGVFLSWIDLGITWATHDGFQWGLLHLVGNYIGFLTSICVSWRFFVWEKFGLVDPLTRKMKITTTCTQHGNLFPYFYNLDTNYIIFVVP